MTDGSPIPDIFDLTPDGLSLHTSSVHNFLADFFSVTEVRRAQSLGILEKIVPASVLSKLLNSIK